LSLAFPSPVFLEPDVDTETIEDDPADEAEWDESGNLLALPPDPTLMLRRISSGEFSTISFNKAGSLLVTLDSRLSMETRDHSVFASELATPYSKLVQESPAVMEGLETQKINGKTVVTQGTPEALVAVFLGADELSMDQDYLHDFLATFRFFLTPADLLDIVVQQYGVLEIIRQRDRSQEESKAFGQRRLLNLLRKWFERYGVDFIRNPGMESRLREFLTSSVCQVGRHVKFIESLSAVLDDTLGLMISDDVVPGRSRKQSLSQDDAQLRKARSGSSGDFVPPTLELLSQLNKAPSPFAQRQQPWFTQEGITGAVSMEAPSAAFVLSETNVQAVAEQLTGLEFHLFRKIEELEFTDHLKVPQDYASPRLASLLAWSEGTIEWVARQVCQAKEEKKRVETIEVLILLAKRCKDLGNYNAVFEIMSGLLLPPVSRLLKTWKQVASLPKMKELWTVCPFFFLFFSTFRLLILVTMMQTGIKHSGLSLGKLSNLLRSGG